MHTQRTNKPNESAYLPPLMEAFTDLRWTKIGITNSDIAQNKTRQGTKNESKPSPTDKNCLFQTTIFFPLHQGTMNLFFKLLNQQIPHSSRFKICQLTHLTPQYRSRASRSTTAPRGIISLQNLSILYPEMDLEHNNMHLTYKI